MLDSELQEVVCCMGQPVAGNPTQFMIERALAAARLDWRYLTFEVGAEQLGDAMRGLRAMGFKGANLTIPHKEAAVEFLDELSESATLMGAVNCVYRDGDRLIGENTDGQAFVETLREVIDPVEKKIVVLGAGGAARSIAVELGRTGAASILVVNRSPDHGQSLVDLLNDKVSVSASLVVWDGDFGLPEDTDILINATSIGLLDPDARVPLDLDTLKPSMLVCDVIFNPPSPWLMRQAAECGCATLSGPRVLVNQAALNFKIWTGQDPDMGIMQEAVEEFLEI